jgi:nucleotide-binding universal stress UspA family protein
MFETIVIGVDGRPGSTDALHLARRLAAPSATLLVTSIAVGFEAADAAQRAVTAVTAGHPELQAEVYVAGSVADGLRDTAVAHGADLIVVGSCHRGAAGRLLLGNDATRAVRNAPCAIAVAPRGYFGDAPLRTIGVGYDRRPESEHALDVARGLAADTGAELRARHVVAIGTWVTPPSAYSGNAIDEEVRTAREHLAALTGVTGDVEVGFPADDLAHFAEEVDLLVVGTRHRSAMGRVILGSTAEMLAGRAATPLLVVPGVAEATAAGAAGTEDAAGA